MYGDNGAWDKKSLEYEISGKIPAMTILNKVNKKFIIELDLLNFA